MPRTGASGRALRCHDLEVTADPHPAPGEWVRPEVYGAGPVRTGPCGMCGTDGLLSRSHVPPQGVGNRHHVARSSLVSGEGGAQPSRPNDGGMHVPGLCASCNGLAGTWDPGYIELHGALGPPLWAETPLHLPEFTAPRRSLIHVGAAARSMLAAACALNPMIRTRTCPDLPKLLAEPDPFELPAELDLRIACATGRRARITGGMKGFYGRGLGRIREPIGESTIAQAHYAPVAWQLVHKGRADRLDFQRWPSIGSWTETPTADTVALGEVCDALPVVPLAIDEPVDGDGWLEVFASTNCFIVLCDDIDPELSAQP